MDVLQKIHLKFKLFVLEDRLFGFGVGIVRARWSWG